MRPAPHSPVLHPVKSLGHVDLLKNPRGNWWAVALRTRHRKQHSNLDREIFLMPAGGGAATRLTAYDHGIGALTWTPDGSDLIFLSN